MGGHVLCVRGIVFVSFYDFVIEFGAVPTVWYFGDVPTVWYFAAVPTVWYLLFFILLYVSKFRCKNVIFKAHQIIDLIRNEYILK